MNDFMLWMLSNGCFGIFLSLVVVIFLLLCLVSGKCGCHNNLMITILMMLVIVVLICGVIGFYTSIDNISAPVSWFKSLPVGESVMMKKKASEHSKPLTIHQFYDVQHKYRDSVEQDKYRYRKPDVMRWD